MYAYIHTVHKTGQTPGNIGSKRMRHTHLPQKAGLLLSPSEFSGVDASLQVSSSSPSRGVSFTSQLLPLRDASPQIRSKATTNATDGISSKTLAGSQRLRESPAMASFKGIPRFIPKTRKEGYSLLSTGKKNRGRPETMLCQGSLA